MISLMRRLIWPLLLVATLAHAEQLAKSGNYDFVYQVEHALRAAGFEIGGERTKTLKPDERAKLRELLKGAKK